MSELRGAWLDHPGTQAVCHMLEAGGFQAYLVGGCVRNALLGRPVADVDMASDARPEQVEVLAKAAGLKSIPTGKDHGTITVLAHGQAYEVTSFRADVSTDGRHAKVRFSKDIKTDAARRDFTMNALYANAKGKLFDPLDGLGDLKAGHVRFIGDASARITEDYLRILRFFRFSAHYGDPALGFDAEGLAGCAEHSDGLNSLSKERIGAEMRKLLAARNPAPAVAAMVHSGVMLRLLPGASPMLLAPLVHLEGEIGLEASWIRRLACIGGEDLQQNLRLSRQEIRQLLWRQQALSGDAVTAELAYRYGAKLAIDVGLLRAAALNSACENDLVNTANEAEAQNFPVSGSDLMPEYSGAQLGAQLKKLENRWIASGFSLTKAELLP